MRLLTETTARADKPRKARGKEKQDSKGEFLRTLARWLALQGRAVGTRHPSSCQQH
jgi:hypothetical protein